MRNIGVGLMVGLAFSAFAGSAHAATLKVTAQIKGSGTILVNRALMCDQSGNLDSRVTADCDVRTFFVPPVWLTAVPPAGNPESKFVKWTGCEIAIATNCQISGRPSGETTKAPVAEFADTTNPVVALAPIPALVGTAAVPLNFTVNDPNADVTCMLDGQWRTCASGPQTLADGRHQFQVMAFDPSGNGAASSISTFTVDATPPKVTFTTRPPARSGATAAFTFDVTKAATTECSLDNGAYKPCAGSFSATNLADGGHLLTVKANDGLHETLTDKAWTVDATAPSITFEALPSPVPTTSVKFAWRVSEPATFTCSIDVSVPVPCRSGFVADDLADGPHTLNVLASDGLNRLDYEQHFVVVAHPIGTAVSITEG
jgi:hypothetical protein